MTIKCAGCLWEYDQLPKDYIVDGNFCRKCCAEVNMRMELRTLLLRINDTEPIPTEKNQKNFERIREHRTALQNGAKQKFDDLLERYNASRPSISWKDAQKIRFGFVDN